MTTSDYRYFEKAHHIADISDYKKTHVGCIAVYKNTIVGMGCNTNKTHPLQKYYNQYRQIDNENCLPKLHAEINCLCSIHNSDIDFSKVKLYIYRIMNNNSFACGMARPCPACMASIKDKGINHIYYTTDNGFAYEYLRGVS